MTLNPMCHRGTAQQFDTSSGNVVVKSFEGKLIQLERMICQDMKGKRHLLFYHVGQKNLGCPDDFFAFFIFNIQVLSSLGDFTISNSMASSQDLGNIKMTTRKAKGGHYSSYTADTSFFLLVFATCRN